ncbi:GntR family transcriptional regulator [Qiania dongpingensis]|uniref:GntR family transcriptional regulator n=1 Tax=Qiania dongpingensis TaxID=2763669 RepID=A0A7G9G0R1_9FIRM|nr:GntR family transcriptional regulator [Qiania dongpingensis]QNM04393.1 GntR family transcriptional regulator [Qiania dongpingensis]
MRETMAAGLDRSIPIPLYFQLENWLLSEIKKGTYSVGQSIPPENQLKEMFQVSRTTVRQAVNKLVQAGWLTRNGTRGTVVTVPKQRSASVRSMEPFNRQIIRAGQVPRTEVLELQIVPADEELAGYFGVRRGDKMISMFRRRFADEVAVMTIRSYLVYETCGFILDHDFSEESLYEVLSGREETKTFGVRQVVEAQVPSPEDMKLFHMDSMKPILSFRCFDRNSTGKVVSYNLIRYRGDFMRFEVDVVEGTSNPNFCPPD